MHNGHTVAKPTLPSPLSDNLDRTERINVACCQGVDKNKNIFCGICIQGRKNLHLSSMGNPGDSRELLKSTLNAFYPPLCLAAHILFHVRLAALQHGRTVAPGGKEVWPVFFGFFHQKECGAGLYYISTCFSSKALMES